MYNVMHVHVSAQHTLWAAAVKANHVAAHVFHSGPWSRSRLDPYFCVLLPNTYVGSPETSIYVSAVSQFFYAHRIKL